MSGGPPGAIAVVQRGRDEKVHAAGVAELGDPRPPRADDHMHVASTAKAFSGAVALSLVDRGVLRLDDTIGSRRPDLPRHWHRVTLRQLLAHTSGVPDFIASPADVSEVLAGGWAWASGGVVSTPRDLNRFTRGYVGGELFRPSVQREQARFGPGGSEAPGPGRNSAGLALFRYETPCGTVYGHTGNTLGYTQFAVAGRDGQRSATVSITAQRTRTSTGPDAAVFEALRAAELSAVCAAMARR